MTSNLPPEVQTLLGANLKSVGQPSAPVPRGDMQREWAEKLDRRRQLDQSRMPAWRDHRLSQDAPRRLTDAEKLDRCHCNARTSLNINHDTPLFSELELLEIKLLVSAGAWSGKNRG